MGGNHDHLCCPKCGAEIEPEITTEMLKHEKDDSVVMAAWKKMWRRKLNDACIYYKHRKKQG